MLLRKVIRAIVDPKSVWMSVCVSTETLAAGLDEADGRAKDSALPRRFVGGYMQQYAFYPLTR
jgi:hypothetical protein